MSLPSLLAFASVLGRSGRENQVLHPAIDLALRLFRVLPGAVAALAHSVFHGHRKKTDSETPIPARWLDRYVVFRDFVSFGNVLFSTFSAEISKISVAKSEMSVCGRRGRSTMPLERA